VAEAASRGEATVGCPVQDGVVGVDDDRPRVQGGAMLQSCREFLACPGCGVLRGRGGLDLCDGWRGTEVRQGAGPQHHQRQCQGEGQQAVCASSGAAKLVAQGGVDPGVVGVDQHHPGWTNEDVRHSVGGDQAVMQHPAGGFQRLQSCCDSGFLSRLVTQIPGSGVILEPSGHLRAH